MKRITAAIFSITVLLIILITGTVSADTPQFTWGMSESEVAGLMGRKGTVDTKSSLGSKLVRYNNQRISDFDATLTFAFRNDALFSRIYAIQSDPNKSKYNYLAEALEIKYGTPVNSKELVTSYFAVLGTEVTDSTLNTMITGGMLDYKTWEVDSNNCIALVYLKTSGGSGVAICYLQPTDQVEQKTYNMDGL